MQVNNAQIEKVLGPILHRVYKLPASSGAAAAQGPDKLILSPKASEVQEAKRQLSRLPEVRTGLIEDLKTKLRNGAYEMSNIDLASRMMSLAVGGRL